MKDVRYSEFVFLQKLAKSSPGFEHFVGCHGNQAQAVGLPLHVYVDMAVTLLEESFVRFDQQENQLLTTA